MERHARNVRPPPLPLPHERPPRHRWPYALTFLALLAVAMYARCGHAADLAAAPRGSDFVFGLVLAVIVCAAAFCLGELGNVLASILTYLFRKDR